MFEMLQEVNSRPKPFEFYTAEILWNDEHISKKMLEFHLNENVDPASRKKDFLKKSLAWIRSRFNIRDGTRVCDFGCGPGLYTTPLAEAGGSVTGIDLSRRSIRYAQTVAKEKDLNVDYVLQNYLNFKTDKKFDLITQIYCDFCPLSPEQRKKLLNIFHKYLDDNGSLLLDVFSLSAFEQRQEIITYEHLLLEGFWSAEDYYGFMNTFKYDREKVILDKYTIVEKSRTWEVYNWLQYFSLESLREEFKNSGFQITEHYADVAGTPWTENSPEIAIIAQKI